MGTLEDSEATRSRIIEVAGHLFAEQGWKTTTVRTIAALAKTHLSAVNYHFENKKKLYEAVLQEALSIPDDMVDILRKPIHDAVLARETLVAIIIGHLAASKNNEQAWKMRLITREFMDPCAAFKSALELGARPIFERFRDLIRVAAGLGATPERIELNAFLLLFAMDSFITYATLAKLLLPNLDQSAAGHKIIANELADVFIVGARMGSTAPLLDPKIAKVGKAKGKSR